MSTTQHASEREHVASGGFSQSGISVRAGFIPVPLERIPADAFEGLELYLRISGETASKETFTLFRAADVAFADLDRDRLLRSGVTLVYIRMNDQARFREQCEACVDQVAADPRIAIDQKSSIVYEIGVELINELLGDPNLASLSPRLSRVSRAITTMVMNDPSSFSHLFAASQHDFYTSTHMVNVAAFMVPLAYELGYRSSEDLTRVCEAGLLHDIGKVYVPEVVLNKPGRLSDEDWWLIQRHPELAYEHLREYDGISEVVLRVAREHHERLDGSGYPHGLRGDDMHPMSKICAIVDAFDAMTALRPFKKRALSVGEAIKILKQEARAKVDSEVLEAWIGLLDRAVADRPDVIQASGDAKPVNRRRHQRFRFNCPARLHVVDSADDHWHERAAIQVVAHSISRSGLGVLSRTPLRIGDLAHVYLHARSWNRDFLEAHVLRCRRFNDGWYEIGMELTGVAPLRSDTIAADVEAPA